MKYLKGKVVVITGGAGRLGREFAKTITEYGGVAVRADIKTVIGDENSVELDITSKASIDKAIKNIKAKHNKIDVLVNNAYPRNENYGRRFEQVTYDDFCANVSSHLGGYFLTSQQFALFFKQQGHGNIINLASIYAVVPPKFEVYEGTGMTMPVEYAAIKSAVIHLTKYMAKYFNGWNIRVNALSPGGILDKQPEGFKNKYRDICLTKGMLEPGDVTGALLFLASDMSQFVNGQNIVVDDGFSL